MDIIRLQNKGRFAANEQARLFKKHGVTKEQYEEAISAYGLTDRMRDAMRTDKPDPGAYDLWYFRRGPGRRRPPRR